MKGKFSSRDSIFVKLRTEKQLTQKQVAEALKVSERTVMDWETGKRVPKLYIHQVKTLCQLLGVSIEDLPDDFDQ